MAKGAPTPASFKPGQSGNPNGRPRKGYSITEMMKRLLKENPDKREKIGLILMKKAEEGDLPTISKVWSYMDGMPPQSIKGEFDFRKIISQANKYTK